MSRHGRFIVFEGGEGAGKSTQARALRDALEARGHRTQLTREPGGSPLAEAIRSVVLGDWPEGVDAVTEALLIFAARAAHVKAVIRPAIAAGTHVICDRFVDASYAYQGAGRGLDAARIAELERLVLADLQPDLVILLDIDPALGIGRIAGRDGNNRFDAETLAFMQRVREAYRRRAAQHPERYLLVDASRAPDEIHSALLQRIEAWL